MRGDEVTERTRRIETRVSKIAEHFGIDVGGGKPVWDANNKRIILPTPNTSMGSALNVVPVELRRQEIDVYVKNEYLLTLFVDG